MINENEIGWNDAIEVSAEGNGEHDIARVFGIDRLANARLIAAAPELFGVAKGLLAFIDKMGEPSERVQSLLDEARATIAKAEGN